MSVPDLVEPLLGYRAWHVARDGSLVPWSAGRSGTWRPGVNTARCLAGAGHRAPAHRCTCGLYALTDHRDSRLVAAREAVGAIVAWGDVEAHRTGFRAEHARIVALAEPPDAHPDHRARLGRAAGRYGVPLVAIDRLADAGRAHGTPLVFERLPRTSPPAERGAAPRLDQAGAEAIAIEEHLRVVIGGRRLSISLTPQLAADLPPGAPIDVAPPGTLLRRGDPLIRAGEGDHRVVLAAPVSASVLSVDPRGGPGRVCELLPTSWDQEAGDLAWGAAGRRAYLAALGHAARSGDPFRHARATWLTAHEHVRSAGDVAAALRAERRRPRFASEHEVVATVGGAMQAALADPEVAERCCRAGLAVAWRLHDPDADLLLDLRGPRPAVRCGEVAPEQADLVLYAAAETADDYFAGRADLPAALRRREVQSRAAAAEVLRLASLTKALHRAYAAARGAAAGRAAGAV